MRRISLALALLGAVASAGCGGGTNPSSSGSARGVPGSTFTVKVRGEKAYFDPATSTTVFLPDGGLVTASGGSAAISCGYQNGAASLACAADYAWGDPQNPTTVTVAATPYAAGGFGFYAFAGSCTGYGSAAAPSTCTVTGDAERLVLVRFARSSAGLGGHENWSDEAVHAAKFRAVGSQPGRVQWKCKECHGATLQGQGLAPSCANCHLGERSMTLHSGSYFAAKILRRRERTGRDRGLPRVPRPAGDGLHDDAALDVEGPDAGPVRRSARPSSPPPRSRTRGRSARRTSSTTSASPSRRTRSAATSATRGTGTGPRTSRRAARPT